MTAATSQVMSIVEPEASARDPVIAVPNVPSATGIAPRRAHSVAAPAVRETLTPPAPSLASTYVAVIVSPLANESCPL